MLFPDAVLLIFAGGHVAWDMWALSAAESLTRECLEFSPFSTIVDAQLREITRQRTVTKDVAVPPTTTRPHAKPTPAVLPEYSAALWHPSYGLEGRRPPHMDAVGTAIDELFQICGRREDLSVFIYMFEVAELR